MDEKKFLSHIRNCRHRLNVARFFDMLSVALCIGAGVGILFQAVSFLVPFYYANLYSLLVLVIAACSALAAALLKRTGMSEAALVMDGFGFRERIVTAYENLGKSGEILELQREDAMERLEKNWDKIKIRIMPSEKKIAVTMVLLVSLFVLSILPSTVRERAKELHQVQQQAKEKEEEIEEVLEELETLAGQELTPEQLAALQEMMESMQSSEAEFKQASSAEMLNTANEKLEYKYENISSQLANMAQSMQNGAAVSQVSAEAMQAMAEKMQQMTESGASQSLASNQNARNQSGNGENQTGNQNSGQNGQSGDGQNGQGDGQSGTGQGQNGQNGSGSGEGPNGENGGTGSGDGSGTGRGEGSGSTPHDYVSIPNEIVDSGNLTGNADNHDDSEFFRTQNGLSWEGVHIPHDAVIGSYEKNAYEGIASGKYPSGMEDVIKEYFSSFN